MVSLSSFIKLIFSLSFSLFSFFFTELKPSISPPFHFFFPSSNHFFSIFSFYFTFLLSSSPFFSTEPNPSLFPFIFYFFLPPTPCHTSALAHQAAVNPSMVVAFFIFIFNYNFGW